eukprot:9339453-Heterocapsa_arctica.AAC.1
MLTGRRSCTPHFSVSWDGLGHFFSCQPIAKHCMNKGVALACRLPPGLSEHVLRDNLPTPPPSMGCSWSAPYVDNANVIGLNFESVRLGLQGVLQAFGASQLQYHE